MVTSDVVSFLALRVEAIVTWLEETNPNTPNVTVYESWVPHVIFLLYGKMWVPCVFLLLSQYLWEQVHFSCAKAHSFAISTGITSAVNLKKKNI